MLVGMNIALNQLSPLQGDPEANFAQMERTIKQNVASGTRLCVFPEDFLFGILRDKAVIEAAARQSDVWLLRFQRLAADYKVDLVPGSQPTLQDGKFYNTATYINASGAIATRYSKQNLWLSERDEYAPSLQMPRVFDGVLGKTALIICWDMMSRELFESIVSQGAEWVICVAFWSNNQSKDLAAKRGRADRRLYRGYSDSLYLGSLIPIRALEYNLGVIFCNFGGTFDYVGNTGADTAISAGKTQLSTPYHQQFRTHHSRRSDSLLFDLNLARSRQEQRDVEIWYGRREDVVRRYPQGLAASTDTPIESAAPAARPS